MLVIKGRVFFQGNLESLSLGIDQGRIVAIKKVLVGDEIRDYGEALILPGGIDLHVHFRDPGFPDKDDFTSGTRSAALGGITTVLDMPNTKPPVTTPAALEEKTARIRGHAVVDYGLYAAPMSAASVPRLHRASAFKVYMAETTGNLVIETDVLPEVLSAAARAGKVVSIHAEDPREFGRRPAEDLRSHDASRPKASEVAALKTLDGMGTPAPMHIAHMTCLEALDARPAGATTEVTPHHLLLDTARKIGPFGKVNPPLRPPESRARLWKAFVDGRIDAVASDHAPHTQEEKGEGPFAEVPAGVPGVGTSFPLLMRRVKGGDLSLARLVAVIATRPAEILRVRKGMIDLDRDADLVVVDPRRIENITAERVRYKCGWTPFEGMEACFPVDVYVRGEPVVERGEAVAEGVGRMITMEKR